MHQVCRTSATRLAEGRVDGSRLKQARNNQTITLGQAGVVTGNSDSLYSLDVRSYGEKMLFSENR